MRKITSALLLLAGLVGFTEAIAQNPGDTIIVQSLNYQSTTRDTVVHFPTGNTQYHKVYMQYSMRCKNAQVSTGQNRNRGCGEWDYSCNTYLQDSSHVDSITATHPDYTVGGFTGTSFPYSIAPTYDFYQSLQPNVTVGTITSDTAATIGAGTLSLSNVLPTDTHAAKSQFLFTGTELFNAGARAGNLDAITLNVSVNPGLAKLFKIKIKATTKTALSNTDPDLTGFTEVYFHQTQFTTGANKLYFSTPFYWDGTSNIIVETSFTNKANGTNISFAGTSGGSGLLSEGDQQFNFNGSNYIEADNYKGILGSSNRTIEAWIKTTGTGDELVAWGNNSSSEKMLIRLNGSGQLRAEFSGSFRVGTQSINDGQWHHIAVVIDGPNVSDADFFIDGQAEAISSTQNATINTTSSINLRLTKGHHNQFLEGNLAEVRIWSSALTATEIQDWMYRKLDNSHTSYSNLEVYYPLTEGSGNTITDMSGNGNHASVIDGSSWSLIYGDAHFKNFENLSDRPNTIFHQGQYAITVANDTVIDSVMRPVHLVNQYAVFSKTGTIYNDSIGVINTNQYWEASPQIVYDNSSMPVDTVAITPDGTINITDLSYWQRNPSRFEIMSFVTPYGIGLDFGQEGKTWTFDMTDFLPIMKGKKRLTIERGGEWQEEMDIKFLFVVGTPVREVKDVQQIWRVDYRSYSDISANKYFEPRDVMLDATGDAFVIKSAITGHGQEGEFIPRNHWININGGSNDFAWDVWKECADNPIYPQGGTWIYDRAGWCPGAPTDVQISDITDLVTAGQTANIDYGMAAATGTSNYIVSHQLVTYGAPNFNQDAAILDIISPTRKVEHARKGAICAGVKVLIQNTGSTDLTSLEMNYWVNNSTTPQTFTWTGNLAFNETEEVVLPANDQLWSDLGSDNKMHVEIVTANGSADDYVHNNKYTTGFDIPAILPGEFLINFQTNSVGSQNSYTIVDQSGNVVFSKSNLSANTAYLDTMRLPFGCYIFRMEDTGDNGISFWANSEGNGSLRFTQLGVPIPYQVFEGDFGKFINFEFTVSTALENEEQAITNGLKLYPNPAQDKFIVEMADANKAEITIYNGVGQSMNLPAKVELNKATFDTSMLSKGVYFVHIKNQNDEVVIKKLTVM